MATPTAALSTYDDFTDLIEDDDDVSGVDALFGVVVDGDEYDDDSDTMPVELEDAVTDLKQMIGDAVDFMESDLLPEWQRADEFYDGDTDVPIEVGRSQVTATTVRDMVRSLKPNAMRVFVQSDEIVEYTPVEALNFFASQVAQQQTKFVNQLFWQHEGYSVLNNVVHNAFLKKVGIVQAYFSEYYDQKYIKVTGASEEVLPQLQNMPDVTIVDVGEPDEGGFFDVEVVVMTKKGKICLEHVPLHEFFVDDKATSPLDVSVIGQRRSVTHSYARSIGLDADFDDFDDFDDYDPETSSDAGGSEARRGYTPDSGSSEPLSASNRKFLLTKAYAWFDLDGTGINQLYCFWLGGTSYEYIKHERVEENPYAVAQIDPVPDAFFGKSIFDILKEDQNTSTSLLRATCDNAHASNNHRLAVHETMVNQADVMSKVLGHPIRFRQPGMIQEIGVQSTVGSMLPLLQYLDIQSQTKAGSTNASMGLDPDALQSTDKEAVRNTIQLGQGQVELMCRNLAETGLRQVFDKLLRLSIRHNPREQIIKQNGQVVPVDQYLFTPDLPMETKVGLGQPDINMKLQGLSQIAAKQEQVIQQFGFSNPLCSINQLFNTITDMSRLMGLPNIGRYFNQLTPEAIEQLNQMQAQQAEASRQEKPSEGIVAAETVRAQARVQEQMLENEQASKEHDRDTRLRMIEAMMKDDYERDKLAQQLAIEDAKLRSTGVDKALLNYEQEMDRTSKMQQFFAKIEEEKRRFEAQQAMAAQQQAMTQQQPPQETPQ